MELHHQLRALVQQRGDAVLADPDVLRAALEDYLDEQAASTGDLNLLVDAVRLGGLARLRSASQGGALPAAAVETAGDYLARQRGSSDVTSAQWACASLGYAVGVVPDQVPAGLRRIMSSGGGAGFPPAGAPMMSPTPVMSPPPTSPAQPWQSGPGAAVGPPPGWSGGPPGAAAYQKPKKSKAPLIAVGAVIALLAVGGGIVWAVTSGGDDDSKADDDTSQTSEATDEVTEEGGEKLTDMEPAEIKDAVVADMNELTSVNMTGEMMSDGEQIRLDLSLDTDGRCTGSMQVRGGSASIISDGQDDYLKGDEQFWIASSGGSAPPEALDMFVGKWMKSPGTGNFGEFCDLNNLLEDFNSGGSADFEIEGTSVVNGREAAQLSTSDGTSILVGNAGPHHILRMSTEGTEAGEFSFSQFNQPLDIEAPTDYVDAPS